MAGSSLVKPGHDIGSSLHLLSSVLHADANVEIGPPVARVPLKLSDHYIALANPGAISGSA